MASSSETQIKSEIVHDVPNNKQPSTFFIIYSLRPIRSKINKTEIAGFRSGHKDHMTDVVFLKLARVDMYP